MGFFDLSLPYSDQPRPGDKDAVIGKASRLKLATKAMELGYVGIAHNRTIRGPMSEKDSCTIPLLTLGSLIKLAPRLASSVGFHRDLLNIPRSTPFRQYTRITVHAETKPQCQALNSGNPILKSYDIVAVRPLTQIAFDDACSISDVDLISIDFDKMQFRLKHPLVKSALQRGVYFEIKYYDLLKDAQSRRQVISNVKLLVDWTKGKNLIISSGATSVIELRGPNDVINLMSLLGLSSERARAALSNNCRNMIAKVLKKKRFHKEAVRVELVSSGEKFSLDQPSVSDDCMKWDPLSSGEGDMLLSDLAKAFDDAAAAHKAAKAIDFASVVDGLPSHGFRFNDIEPPVAVEASFGENLGGMDCKEVAVGLRKCSSSQGQDGVLTRCTNLATASDVNKCNNAIHEDMVVEEEKGETGESNIISLANISSETSTDLLRESSESLSQGQEAVGDDQDQASRTEAKETEVEIPYHNTSEITKEGERETTTENSEMARAKRSRDGLRRQRLPFKRFLLHSRFKRISKRGRRRRTRVV